MKRLISICLIGIMSITMLGCAQQSDEKDEKPYVLENRETRNEDDSTVIKEEPEPEKELAYYDSSNTEPGYYVSEIFPWIAFKEQEEYTVFKEAEELSNEEQAEGEYDMTKGSYYLILDGPNEGQTLDLYYYWNWKTADGSWNEKLNVSPNIATYTIIGETEGYTIYEHDNPYMDISSGILLVLPKNWDSTMGGIEIWYGPDDATNRDIALEYAKSILPSKFTNERYVELFGN